MYVAIRSPLCMSETCTSMHFLAERPSAWSVISAIPRSRIGQFPYQKLPFPQTFQHPDRIFGKHSGTLCIRALYRALGKLRLSSQSFRHAENFRFVADNTPVNRCVVTAGQEAPRGGGGGDVASDALLRLLLWEIIET